MKRSRLSRWVAVLALVIAPVTMPVTAEETATITITGTFKMDWMWGTSADLASVFANGNEHTWTATLHGVTHSHWSNGSWVFNTSVHATSFEFQFSGPDADVLNAAVGDKLGGPGASLNLTNYYGLFAQWGLYLPSADPDAGVYFWAYDDTMDLNTAFTVDADGFPVPPLQAVAYESGISDGLGFLSSYFDTVDVTGDLGPHTQAMLGIGDAAIAEGDRGSRQLTLSVTLSDTSDQTVTVDYRTVDGTAVSGGKGNKADYAAASGTLSFQPGETVKTIAISIKSDRMREGDEYFTVQLSNAAGAPIADGFAIASILNDD